MKNLAWWVHVLWISICALGCAPEEGEKVGVDEGKYETAGGGLVLVRSSGEGRFWLTVGKALPGMLEEARYGIRSAGEIPLYACWASAGVMPSNDPACEGHPRLGIIGYLNTVAGVPLYRCRGVRYGSGDAYHFVSTSVACDGRTVEGRLGNVDSAVEDRPAASLELPIANGGGEGGGDGSPGGSGDGAGGVGAGGSL